MSKKHNNNTTIDLAEEQSTSYQVHRKLRDRFILFFIVLAAVPVLLLSAVSLYLVDLSHRHDVSQTELLLIDQTAEEIQTFIDETTGILEVRVDVPAGQDITESSQLFILQGLLDENSAFIEAAFANRAGVETTKLSRTGGETELIDVARLPQFTVPREGARYVGDVYHTVSGPMVTLAAPVFGNDNAILHVITAEVSLASLVRSIERTSLGTSGYVLVLDKRGSVVAHGSSALVSSGESVAHVSRVQRILNGELLDGLDARDRYESMLDTTPVVGAGKLLPVLGWAVLVEWPLTDADSVIADIRNQAVIFTLFVIVAVLALAPLFAHRLVKPIRKLRYATQKIEQGDLDATVSITTNDELQELGESFNYMIDGLKRLQELKDEFVFIAAHELRAPVTAMRGYLGLIREEQDKLPQGTVEPLDIVWKSNERLVQLVNDILEIARSDAGKMTIQVAPCDITESITQVISEAQSLADEKHITLVYEHEGVLPQVLADPVRVSEILMNFISNAIKYNNVNGAVEIEHEITDTHLTTSVRDNGFGLSVQDQQKLFEKFFRVQSPKTKSIQGTGLGLFIVKELVEKMNGTVSVESTEGKGSTFSFTLPRV